MVAGGSLTPTASAGQDPVWGFVILLHLQVLHYSIYLTLKAVFLNILISSAKSTGRQRVGGEGREIKYLLPSK